MNCRRRRAFIVTHLKPNSVVRPIDPNRPMDREDRFTLLALLILIACMVWAQIVVVMR